MFTQVPLSENSFNEGVAVCFLFRGENRFVLRTRGTRPMIMRQNTKRVHLIVVARDSIAEETRSFCFCCSMKSETRLFEDSRKHGEQTQRIDTKRSGKTPGRHFKFAMNRRFVKARSKLCPQNGAFQIPRNFPFHFHSGNCAKFGKPLAF